MKPRKLLTASEVDGLIKALAMRLRSTAVETQPEVASRLLELIREDTASIGEFAAIIKTDSALSGRLLRMANSAYFAQRDGVTTIERAAVLLGIQRIKAISLGFYLSRSVGDPAEQLSRLTWGHSLYRACLASELAQVRHVPNRAEAFMIGLLMDCGIPLMYRMIGPAYQKALTAAKTPARLFQVENDALGFTHVDVASALCTIWKLPDLLRKPIDWHHTRPDPAAKKDTLVELHRIAYYIGSIDLTEAGPAVPAPNQSTAQGVLDIDVVTLKGAVSRATDEFRVVKDMFAEIADCPSDLDKLAKSAHAQLLETIDAQMINQLDQENLSLGENLEIDEARITLKRSRSLVVACRLDSRGNPLVSFEFQPERDSLEQVLDALGIDQFDQSDLDRFKSAVNRLAA